MNALTALQNRLETYVCSQINKIADRVFSKLERVVYSLIVWQIDATFRDNPKICADIRKIDFAIEALETRQNERAALQALNSKIELPDTRGGIAREERLFIGSGERGIHKRQETLRSDLIGALKTHRTSVILLQAGLENQRVLTSMKSEFMRLQDLLSTSARRPAPDALIEMVAVNTSRWPCIGKPIVCFPEEAWKFRYAEDTGKNNLNAVITADGKYAYKKDTSWAKTLHFVEDTCLEMPLKACTPDQLEELFDALAEQLNLIRRTRESIVSATGMVHSRRNSIQEAFQRWGHDFHLASKAFSAADWKALSDEYFVAPRPEDMATLRHQFFNQLHHHLQNVTLHPFQVAGFIHWTLMRMRPFHDDNGSIIRLYMNIWLMQNGLPPLVVSNNDEYIKLFTAPHYVQAFGDYLSRK